MALPQEDCAKNGYKAGYEVNNCNHASISLTTHSKPTKYIDNFIFFCSPPRRPPLTHF